VSDGLLLPGEDPEPLPNHLDLVVAAADVGWFDWDAVPQGAAFRGIG
jgi:hypothetical protein